ncbi:HTH-type transcriptional regulator YesS [Paenibacillus konkukensis]|uniref:HTH-type transcriptional regulator YesS n=1 Tax=Paenibacillus konkukensis TaxID=2020716 RepID=A0ABY4RJJ2_9BACL|nr:helix-turn-helix domain-containing protein [Paenibacillus konkukensis]UQZ82382.1 HTH-type transcriptional regulator YesS [Paenibacillus konkukensis]
MKLKLSRYQTKLFMLCLLLGAVPVVVLGIFSYMKSSSLIESKVLKGNDQLLLQTQTQLENTLKIIDFSIFQLGNSQAVTDVLQTPINAKNYPLVDKLLESMQRIQIYELGIRDIELINMDQQWIINNKGYAKLEEALDPDYPVLLAELDKPIKWMTQAPKTGPGQTGPTSVYLIKRFPNYSLPSSAYLVTQMSTQQLFKTIPRSSELGSLIVLDDKGDIMETNMEAGRELAMRSLPVFEEVRQSSELSGYRTGTIGQEEFGFTFRKSTYNGWTYVSMVSLDSITRESKSIGWATLWACAVMIAAIIMLSLQGTNNLYRPVRSLYQKATDPEETGGGLQDTQDEFTVIERRIDKMSQNYLHVTGHVKRLRMELRPFMMFKLAQGELSSHEIQEQLSLFGYNARPSWLAVVTIRIDSLKGTRFGEPDRDLLLYAISNIVEETIPADRRLYPIVMEQAQMTVIAGNEDSQDEFKQFLSNAIRQVQANVLTYLGIPVSAGISRPYKEYEQTYKAYAEGLDALKYRIAKQSETILFIENEEPETQMVFFPEHLEKQLVEAVKFADEKRAHALLKEFLQILSNRELTHNQMQNWLMKLLLDLLYIPEQAAATFASLDTNAVPLYEQLQRLNTVQEIEQWFHLHIIAPMIETEESGKEAPYQKISNEVIRIIQTEYDRDLTLEECASRLNYHSSYLRRALKKSLNVNFTEYLLSYRMEIAKKWLMETEMKIADISQKLQYNNPQNFIRYFKKTTGMTPGQYRGMWLNEQNGE